MEWPRSDVLGLLDQQSVAAFQQRTLLDEQGAMVIEAVLREDVLAQEGVTGMPPLQFIGEPAVQREVMKLREGLAHGVSLLKNRSTFGSVVLRAMSCWMGA